MTNEEFRNKYSKEIYLGDGLYAHFDGFHIILTAPRENGNHWVALDPEIFENLLEYKKALDEDTHRLVHEE